MNDEQLATEVARTRIANGIAPCPALYQLNTRVWLTALSRSIGRPATLDDIPDGELDRIMGMGFDWVWLLSVWCTGPAGKRLSRTDRDLRREFEETLSDLREDDIGGSGFAITGYTVDPALGGRKALARLRDRLARRGLKLMLDFVPNHTALDHPWVAEHPEYYVAGTELDLIKAPRNYTRVGSMRDRIFAHGRDPYFPGWPDTLQLNYENCATQEVMIGELRQIAGQCDGVRCDMAMLVLPDVFERTWHLRSHPFWPEATARTRERNSDFLFMAEVYWDLEWTLLQQGFDYAYDKRLYDRLCAGPANAVRGHLQAALEYQCRLARFLENHDEPRAAATFPEGKHEAAALVTYLTPGLRFFHQGQVEGYRKRISPHLVRGPAEPVNNALRGFYQDLLTVLRHPVVREGAWRLLDCVPAWDGNWTHDCFLAWCWRGRDGERLLAVVNYADHQSQSYVRVPWSDLPPTVTFADLMSPAVYDCDGADLAARGLYLDLPAFGRHVFEVSGKR
jgi:hypothetical protein